MMPDPPSSGSDSSKSRAGNPQSLHSKFNFDLDDASWLAHLRERIGGMCNTPQAEQGCTDNREDVAASTECSSAETEDAIEDSEPPVTTTIAGTTPDIGRRVGAYVIRRLVGSGGMGSVYEAIQDNPRRRVALKMMKSGFASRSAMRRFEYEAQTLARLRHPGIAQIYDAGTCGDETGGVPYFAMEYIPNAKPITQYAKEHKLGTRQRLELFTQACDAVHHGHQKGVIHRDLKPSNILVEKAGR
jgi:serine/threonine protein kinase